jgi:hypothetical protein
VGYQLRLENARDNSVAFRTVGMDNKPIITESRHADGFDNIEIQGSLGDQCQYLAILGRHDNI